MGQNPLSHQPETAWYQRRLQEQRQFRLVMGIVLLCVTLYFFFGTFIQFSFQNPMSLVICGLCILFLIWYGASEVLINRGPVPVEAIHQLRQQERSLLFRQAQGALPWQYHRWFRLAELLFALFSFYLAATHIVLAPLNHPQWLSAGVYMIVGLVVLIDVFYFKPRYARHLAARSASELSYRLRIGETTGDNSY